MFVLLMAVFLAGCEIDTEILVSSTNPPQITFGGSGGIYRLFISGPYTKEEMDALYSKSEPTSQKIQKQAEKTGKEEYLLWELDPANVKTNLPNIPAITYGTVTPEFRQVYPPNGQPPAQLVEGKYYVASAPSYGANSKITIFRIHNDKTETISIK